jgi:hypothetical protein
VTDASLVTVIIGLAINLILIVIGSFFKKKIPLWRIRQNGRVLSAASRSILSSNRRIVTCKSSACVISVTQAGDTASVLLGFDNADDLSDGWVDLHTLLRIDGAWKIMNKTATHCSRAAWARFHCVRRTRRTSWAALSSTRVISASVRFERPARRQLET